MSDVVVIGAGGHAKVCIELLRAAGYVVVACIGADGGPPTCLDVPVIIGDDRLIDLRRDGLSRAFVAVGSNRLRGNLASMAVDVGFELVSAISPSAQVSPSASLGQGVAIMNGVVINADVEIGDFVIVNTGATIDHDCKISEGVHVAPQCGIAGNVTVGRRSFLGIGTSVVPERRIGDEVTVGAGSVVIYDLADGVTAVGSPARVIRAGVGA